MTGLMRAEWLKITRQGTTKTLVGMMLGISALIVVALSASVLGTGPAGGRQGAFAMLDFPNGLLTGVQMISNVGLLIVAVFFASVIGSEYGLDTWKNLLIRRHGRGNFLVAKLAVAGVALLIIFAFSIAVVQLLSFAGHAVVADTAAQAGLQTTALTWDQFGHKLLVSGVPLLLNLTVAAAIAMMCTIIGRSTVAGIMLTIVWNVADSLVADLIPGAADLTLSKNLAALGRNLDVAGSGALPVWQSLLAIGLYIILPLVVGVVFFRQRDMAGN